MKKTIAVLAGDGIGPEVMAEAIKVLEKAAEGFGHEFTFQEALIGGAAWEPYGRHFPDETKQICERSDAILFGSVGGPIHEQGNDKWRDCERHSILAIAPIFSFSDQLKARQSLSCPSRFVRFTSSNHWRGGGYLMCERAFGRYLFGEHRIEKVKDVKTAMDVMAYDEDTIADIAHAAFQAAQKRKFKVASVDKANVLARSRLWREVVTDVSKGYPDCQLEHILVDNCAMQLIRCPTYFDVLLMPNMFGDIYRMKLHVLGGFIGIDAFRQP